MAFNNPHSAFKIARMKPSRPQDQSQLKWIADFIWNIADDRMKDVHV